MPETPTTAGAGARATARTVVKSSANGMGSKPDFATLGGIAIALLGIVGGLLLEKGSIQDIAQGTAAMIVLGGTLGAVLVTSPLSVVMRAVGGIKNILLEPVVPTHE